MQEILRQLIELDILKWNAFVHFPTQKSLRINKLLFYTNFLKVNFLFLLQIRWKKNLLNITEKGIWLQEEALPTNSKKGFLVFQNFFTDNIA